MGWIGVGFGALTAILVWYYLPVSIITAFPGFLFSSLYVMLSSKYEIETPKINPGYLGMLLSSAPVIGFLAFLLLN